MLFHLYFKTLQCSFRVQIKKIFSFSVCNNHILLLEFIFNMAKKKYKIKLLKSSFLIMNDRYVDFFNLKFYFMHILNV